jgi:hypothetical protein
MPQKGLCVARSRKRGGGSVSVALGLIMLVRYSRSEGIAGNNIRIFGEEFIEIESLNQSINLKSRHDKDSFLSLSILMSTSSACVSMN